MLAGNESIIKLELENKLLLKAEETIKLKVIVKSKLYEITKINH